MSISSHVKITSMMILVLISVSFTEYAYAETHYVRVNDLNRNCGQSCFLPSIANVTVGDTIVWLGDGRDHHIFNTTAGERIDIVMSQNIMTFSHTFNSSGVFPYIDSFYPWSNGEIVVREYKPPPIVYSLNFTHPTRLVQPIVETKTLVQSIPDWLKINLMNWSNGNDNDLHFLQGIQYFNETKIIHIPSSSLVSNDNVHVPSWIKHNTVKWMSGTISDNDFVQGIQYLLNSRIILVPSDIGASITMSNPSTEVLKQFIRVGNTFYIDQELVQGLQAVPNPNYSVENGKIAAYYTIYLGKTPQGNKDLNYESIFDDAVKRWENANDNLHFKFTPYSDQANILVQFVARDLGWSILGHSTVGKGFVEVQVGDDQCNGNFELYNNATLENIMIHEIGHGIGLSHSTDSNDIMYPSTSVGYQYCTLTPRN